MFSKGLRDKDLVPILVLMKKSEASKVAHWVWDLGY